MNASRRVDDNATLLVSLGGLVIGTEVVVVNRYARRDASELWSVNYLAALNVLETVSSLDSSIPVVISR